MKTIDLDRIIYLATMQHQTINYPSKHLQLLFKFKDMKILNCYAGITVLSLFDGMSCGNIALKKLGIPTTNYYASEIDKFAIQQTQHNFPDTIQLGDVVFLRYAMTWKESTAHKFYDSKWISCKTKERFKRLQEIEWNSINLILAGSPCQGFSFAGKQLAFNDPLSKLFFEFIKILSHIKRLNPDVKFLLENVDMKRSHMKVISDYCGVFPVNINSNLVSAQNRNRWYWTNIRTKQIGLFGEIHSDIPQPKDKGILLRDILEKEVDEKYYLSDKRLEGMINHKNRHKANGHGFGYSFSDGNSKSNTILSRYYKDGKEQLICLTPKSTEYGKQIRKDYESGKIKEQRKNISSLEPRQDGKTNTLTCVQKDNLILHITESSNLLVKESTKKGYTEIKPGECFDFENPKSKTRRGRKMESKSNCLMAAQNNFMQYTNDYRIRRLTPKEVSRLQTIPEDYEWIVSDTQIYKMCGNGWTIDVIAHILSFMFVNHNQINQGVSVEDGNIDMFDIAQLRKYIKDKADALINELNKE